MRMLTLELWSKWPKIQLHLSRPALGLDGTNNASERGISKSKVRYKSMRGYKSMGGMNRHEQRDRSNPMALKQRRRARSEQGDGGMKHRQRLTEAVSRIRPPSMGQSCSRFVLDKRSSVCKILVWRKPKNTCISRIHVIPSRRMMFERYPCGSVASG